MNKVEDIFRLESEENIKRLVIDGVGNIVFDGTKLSFNPQGCCGCEESFNLKENSLLYIKKMFFSKITELPLKERVNSVALFQNFLKYSYEILSGESLSENFLFIPKEDYNSRGLLCKVFIELLEENNLNLTKAYGYTYIRLLEIYLKLIEETKALKDDELYYAISKWLNACQNYQYKAFEDNKIDREEKINEAIFINGKPRFCHIKEYIKKQADKDERFKKMLIDTAIDWYLKSRYYLKPARIILWTVKKKLIYNLLLPRMFSAIIIGYILLVMAEETWILAYNMWIDKWPIILTTIFSLVISFLYLCVEISKIGKDVKRRSFNIFIVGLVESAITGIFVNFIINKYYTPEKLSLDQSIWEIPYLYHPQVILFFAPLALFIGIFVQIIWEDKPITHPL